MKKDTVAATLEAALDALDRGRVRQGDWQAIGAFPKSAKRPGPDPAKADSCAVYSVDPRSGKKELRRPAPKKTGRQRAVRKKAMASS